MDIEARLAALESQLAATQARLAVLEDQEAIRECLYRYSFNADVGRSEEWVGTWTPDGVYQVNDVAWAGADRLMDLIASPANLHQTIENSSLHNVLNLFIRVEGETAWAEGYSIVVILKDGKYEIWSSAYTNYRFARIDGQWFLTWKERQGVGGPHWGGRVIHRYLDHA